MPITFNCKKDQQTFTYKLSPDENVENLLVLIAFVTNIEVMDQELKLTGPAGGPLLLTAAMGAATFGSCGIADNSVIAVEVGRNDPNHPSEDAKKSKQEGPATTTAAAATGPTTVVPPTDPQRRGSEEMLGYLEGDAKLQQMLYERIQQQNIQDSLEAALEFNPEAFAQVVMLFVPCEINHTPMKAFVDTGAQVSIISAEAAERCGIMRLLDRRMRGVAVGVGQQEILGRVHATLVKLGDMYVSFSFSVLQESSIDVIIGLDQLKRHAMCVDLKRNVLQIEDKSVPFLSEAEIPRKRAEFMEALAKEREEQAEAEKKKKPSAATSPVPPAVATAPVAPAANTAKAVSGSGGGGAAPGLTASQREAVQQVRDFVGADVTEAQAAALLEAAGWNVEAAVGLFMED